MLNAFIRGALATLALTLLCASPASAWQYGKPTARPGAVTDAPPVFVPDWYQNGFPILTLLMERGPTVSRSPVTTGDQNISVVYEVQRWSGSNWYQSTYTTSTVRISAGYGRVRLPALFVQPTNGVGITRVIMGFTWRTPAGRLLGHRAIYPHRTGDHQCISRARSCAAYPHYANIGRVYSVGGGFVQRSAPANLDTTVSRFASLAASTR